MAGVVFPPDGDKGVEQRGTTPTAKAVLQAALDALAPKDAAAAAAATKLRESSDKSWRFGYQKHVRAVVAGMARGDTADAAKQQALLAARAGLQTAQTRFAFNRGGEDVAVRDAVAPGAFNGTFATGTAAFTGAGPVPQVPPSFIVPFQGKTYSGRSLETLLRRFSAKDEAEPSFADAAAEIVGNEATWGDLRGQVFVLLGATSEMGPCSTLLAHGATVVALARKAGRGGPAKWREIIQHAEKSPGTLLFPMAAGTTQAGAADPSNAGADVLQDTPEIVNWLVELFSTHPKCKGKRAHVYSGIYLDGGKFVRASVAMDAVVDQLTDRLGRIAAERRGPSEDAADVALVYIDTPSHCHVVRKSVTYAGQRKQRQKVSVGLGLAATAGLVKGPESVMLPRADARETMVCMDFLSATQGPNYAVAKLLQRFRALFARHGTVSLWPDAKTGADVARAKQFVSITSGPAAKTESVMHSKTMSLMMNNVHRVPPNVAHEPSTVQVVMTMVLIRDLNSRHALGNPANEEPSRSQFADVVATADPFDFLVENAWHGGMWRSPYGLEDCGKYIYVTVMLQRATPYLALAGAAVAGFLYRAPLMALLGTGEL